MDLTRKQTFQRLKPSCVELLELALNHQSGKATGKDVTRSIEAFYSTVSDIARAGRLDVKLAEYVFYPLGHVFRQNKELPERCNELAVQCLQLLIVDGWGQNLSVELAKELFLLLLFFVDQMTTGGGDSPGEDLKVATYRCLVSLFGVGDADVDGKEDAHASRRRVCIDMLADEQLLPAAGSFVFSALRDISEGESRDVQSTALSSLEAFARAVPDNELLIKFLPGLVSALTKTLTVSPSTRHSVKVLSAALQLLRTVISATLADSASRRSVPEGWLNATAGQMQVALGAVIPLRKHERTEVRHALLELCVTVLDECSTTLNDCKSMMVETAIALSSEKDSIVGKEAKAFLQGAIVRDDAILDVSKSSLDSWASALSRTLTSDDEGAKERLLDRIYSCLDLLSNYSDDCGLLAEEVITPNVCAGISAASRGSAFKGISAVASSSLELLAADGYSKRDYSPVLFSHHAELPVITKLQSIISLLSRSQMFPQVARSLMTKLSFSTGEEELAILWFSKRLLESHHSQVTQIDEFIEVGDDNDTSLTTFNSLANELYAHALHVLLDSTSSIVVEDPDPDPRLPALALETVSFQARRQGSSFRPELVDALYPVLHLLGSSDALLQQHAIVTLNVLSSSLAYTSVRSLVIENVDYLVNAVTMKLNTFDISPQAPKVLNMMIQLCGADLLPYLESTIESLFAILDSFHGYEGLVTEVFSVFSTIVEVGAKSEGFQPKTITENGEPEGEQKLYEPLTISDLAKELKQRKQKADDRQTKPVIEDLAYEPTPHRPWGTEHASKEDEAEEASPPHDAAAPAPSKPYTIISSIATEAQYHLTSASPQLRLQILQLLCTAFPTLSRDQNAFLPLVNVLWPVIVPRLFSDSELPVRIAAAKTIAVVCECAGDFMRSRIDDVWSRVYELWQSVCAQMREERTISTGTGVFARFSLHAQLLDALKQLLGVVVTRVGASVGIEQDIIDIVAAEFDKDHSTRQWAQGVNADAVWWHDWRAGKLLLRAATTFPKQPHGQAWAFTEFSIR